MNVSDPDIVKLRMMVTAAQREFDMAVAFHEVWKPAAYDEGLHSRMGRSFASQAFLITRTALRREMLLALARLWDKNKQSLRMSWIADTLGKQKVVRALAQDRVNRLGVPESIDQMINDLGEKADEVVRLIRKYMEGGSNETISKLLKLRNESLAHRQLIATSVVGANATDNEIEEVYQDNSKLVHILVSLVNATAYNPAETAIEFRNCARHFWAGARGEQTEGHPSYRQRRTGNTEL